MAVIKSIFILIILTGLGLGKFEEKPQNTCAVTGDTLELTCSIKGEHIQNWKNPQDDYISGNNQVAEDYAGIFEIVGNFNLQILNASPSLAGRYTCEDTSASGAARNAFAEVIVLEPLGPILSTPADGLILENDFIRYTCTVKYGGNIIPSVKWKSSRSGKTIPHNLDVDDGFVTSTMDISGTVQNNGDSFVCSIFFEALTVTGTNVATNVPECTMKGESVPLIVHYSPRNTYISSEIGETMGSGAIVRVGQTLTCQSHSNPPVGTYEWYILKGSEYKMLGQGQSLLLQSEDVGSVRLICIVTNLMGRTFTTQTADSVNITLEIVEDANDKDGGRTQDNSEHKDEGLSDSVKGGIVAGAVIVALGCLAFGGFVIHSRKKSLKETHTKNVDPEGNQSMKVIREINNYKTGKKQSSGDMQFSGNNAITAY